ncbi:type VII secretion integral membrane protein EccD [Nocardia higoensis]|uniref:type VII secretion integral membrane protein EccD n=1 Tax=Nocardia higoensis TaxID=228599 RepID=UPI000594CFFC|nr:type VII secretion integral membrane protein EccD [Nocardia higoensis]
MTESSSNGATAVDPELCRVSVIGGNTQLDMGLPASIPVAAYIADVVRLIDSRNPDPTESDESAPPVTRHWTLARLGRDPIPPHQSLAEAEIYDGELLVLRSVTAKELPALFDDVIDAVARLSVDEMRGWSAASARWTGLVAGLIAVLTALALLLLDKGTGIAGGFVPLGAGLLAAGAAVIAGRRYQDQRVTVIVLGLYASVLLGAAAALLTPGRIGSPHLLFGAVACLAAALVIYAGAKAGALVTAAVVATAAVLAIAALVRMIWACEVAHIAVGVLLAGLILITLAPRLAVAAAKLPVPPVPTAGAAIDPADHEPRPTIEDIGAIGATALPSAAGLEQRARAANQFQSGLLLAAAVLAAGGAVLAADPFGGGRWQGQALAAIVAVVLCLRGRAYADMVQAAVLIGAGTLTGFGVITGMALAQEDRRLIGAGIVLIAGLAAVGFGVIGPHTEVSPVVRRAVELFEYLLIVLIVPLALWVMDVYSAARNLTF